MASIPLNQILSVNKKTINNYIRIMNSKLEKLLQDDLYLLTGFAYAVPLQWWKQFSKMNNQTETLEELQFPELNLDRFTDSFLFEYMSYIVEQLEHKCNYLKFNRVFISPTPKPNLQWQVVSPSFWKRFSQKYHKNEAIVIYHEKENPQKWINQQKSQLQIVFCSKNGSEAFIGYFPQNLKITEIVRAIGFELGFIEMEQSRVMYPDKNHGRVYYFAELQGVMIKNASDTLIMAYNLEKQEKCDDERTMKLDVNMNSSNEAAFGDLGMVTNQSWQNMLNNRTMSTGAETPSFAWSDEQNGEFRVRELFRERKPEQIEQMKQYAQKCMKGELICLPEVEDEAIEKHLEMLAEEMVELAGMHKKKILKDKQFYNQ